MQQGILSYHSLTRKNHLTRIALGISRQYRFHLTRVDKKINCRKVYLSSGRMCKGVPACES